MKPSDINTSLIFNKLTEKCICKFVSLYEINEFSSCSKDEFRKKLHVLMGENALFETIPFDKFIEFYIKTELAGQKHFYFYKFEIDENILNRLNEFKQYCINEEKRDFKTSSDEEWYYIEKENEIIFKYITLKEIYTHLEDTREENKLHKIYEIKTIHNILFFRFLLDKNIVIIGIDKYSALDTEKDIRKNISDKFDLICEKDSYKTLEGLLDNQVAEKLLYLDNVLVSNIKNEINQTKKSAMHAKYADIQKVLDDINKNLYSVNQVKIKNPDLDILSHPTFEAEQSKKYLDGIEVDIQNIQAYWFSKKYKKADVFRIKIDIVNSTITTFSPSITQEEFEDVISQIV